MREAKRARTHRVPSPTLSRPQSKSQTHERYTRPKPRAAQTPTTRDTPLELALFRSYWLASLDVECLGTDLNVDAVGV